MYKQETIKVEKLREFYGLPTDIPILSNRYMELTTAVTIKTGELGESLVIEKVNGFTHGNFQSVKILQPANIRGYYLLSPKNLIEIEEKPDLIDVFTSVLNRMMPGHWCTKGNRIFLHYPQINITNSLDQHYTVYDIIVELIINEQRLESYLYGWKYSFTKEELDLDENMFYHPHLNLVDVYEDDNVLRKANFCLGSSSLSSFLKANENSFNETKFELLLYQIKEYLEWESLEGGPHYSIGNFSLNSEDINYPNPPDKIFNEITLKLLQKLPSKFILNNTFEPSVAPEELYKIELELVKEIDDKYLSDYSVETNKFIAPKRDLPDNEVELPEVYDDQKFVMDTLNITPRLLPNPERKQIPTIKRINPRLFEEIITQINQTLHNKI